MCLSQDAAAGAFGEFLCSSWSVASCNEFVVWDVGVRGGGVEPCFSGESYVRLDGVEVVW